MGLKRVIAQWIERDEHRMVLMEGPFVVGEIRSTMNGWSAVWAGEVVAKGIQNKGSAQIAVARARARAITGTNGRQKAIAI